MRVGPFTVVAAAPSPAPGATYTLSFSATTTPSTVVPARPTAQPSPPTTKPSSSAPPVARPPPSPVPRAPSTHGPSPQAFGTFRVRTTPRPPLSPAMRTATLSTANPAVRYSLAKQDMDGPALPQPPTTVGAAAGIMSPDVAARIVSAIDPRIRRADHHRPIIVTFRTVTSKSVPEGPSPPAPTPGAQRALIQAATTKARAAVVPSTGLAAALDAAATGRVIDDSALDAENRTKACCALIDCLPLYSLAYVCGKSEEDLLRLDASRLVAHVISYSRKWSSAYIQKAVNAWLKFLVWLAARDDDDCESPDGSISFILLCEYAAFYDQESRAKCAARANPGLLNDKGRLPQTGATAADAQITLLKFLQTSWGLRLPIDKKFPRFGEGANVVRNPRQSAPPFPLKAVIDLERFCVDESMPFVLRGFSAALLYVIFHGSRIRQAQKCAWFYRFNDTLFGRTMDKSGEARRIWCPLCGIYYGDQWFEVLQRALAGFEAGGAVFRQFYSDDGDPRHPSARFVPAPMDDHTILKCLHIILEMACPWMPRAEISRYTLHSARHVLQYIAAARNEEPTARIEFGRWKFSTAARDRCPAACFEFERALALTQLPDLYSQEVHVDRIIKLYHRQWTAVREWADRLGGPAHLPHTGGWEELRKFDKSTELG